MNKKWKNSSKSGCRDHPIYTCWLHIKSRCNNPKDKNYKNYGERGITIYPSWMDYDIFYDWCIANGFDESLQIDRINNDSGYLPSNCRFVSRSDNLRNRRGYGKSIHKGVVYDKRRNRWRAVAPKDKITNKQKFLGSFENESDAQKCVQIWMDSNT